MPSYIRRAASLPSRSTHARPVDHSHRPARPAALEVRLTEEQTERCLDFIDTLWNATGGFHGNWTDDYLDCEYTFYGLLALGHLSLNG